MKKLVIVESPTKAKTIGNFLPDDAVVIASMGHIRDIPDKGMNVNLDTFVPVYRISADKKEIVRKLKGELADSSALYLATDEDREGESISWHLMEVLKPQVPVYRMVFHEITAGAIRQAFENTRNLDENMVAAQEARRVLDRVFGYSVSPLLWTNLGNNRLSAGRVQSPALKLIVDREYRRMNFKSRSYCIIKGCFGNSGKVGFEAFLSAINSKKIVSSKDFFDEDTGELKDPESVFLDIGKAKEIGQRLEHCEFTVSDVASKVTRTQPPVPFITSTLQQESNTKLHLSASDTMSCAQKLYESGLITYMRTDSPSLSAEGTAAARASAAAAFGEGILSPAVRKFKSRDPNSQNAHEAIRPAVTDGRFRTAEELGLSGREAKLYSLIYRRTLACQAKECVKEVRTVKIAALDGSDEYVFTFSESKVLDLGFRKIYEVAKSDDENAAGPDLKKGEQVFLDSLDLLSKETNPPKRYSEAGLIKEMERLCIGRPSTYAAIISGILVRKYVQKQDGMLVPTFLGFGVIKFLSGHFAAFIDAVFTSKMEENLDRIEAGKVNKTEYLSDFYNREGGLSDSLSVKTSGRKEESRLSFPQVSEKYGVFIGKYGPYVTAGEKSYSIPQDFFPYMLNDKSIEELIGNADRRKDAGDGFEVVSRDPATGADILFNPKGKYGPYFFVKGEKKFVSLPRNSKLEDWNSDEIARMFSMPLNLGNDSEGNAVVLSSGKFGPYLSYKKKNVSVKDMHKALSVTLGEALEMFGPDK